MALQLVLAFATIVIRLFGNKDARFWGPMYLIIVFLVGNLVVFRPNCNPSHNESADSDQSTIDG